MYDGLLNADESVSNWVLGQVVASSIHLICIDLEKCIELAKLFVSRWKNVSKLQNRLFGVYRKGKNFDSVILKLYFHHYTVLFY